jgi:ubiquinone/menaquinone biosynthesis C-methylase UbiE
MEKIRKPFQGVRNIVRFNWHFYVLALGFLLLLLLFANYADAAFTLYILLFALLIVFPVLISLSVSYYVYDLSGLYKLIWIDSFIDAEKSKIININAGFDETSILLKDKFPNAELIVLDFYNPEKHTELSIKRARKTYPVFPGTKAVTETSLPIPDNSADKIFVIFAAHEIRNEDDRIKFFMELKRIIKPAGQIIVTEHLRDTVNFWAFNIGFLHFYSKQSWLTVFQSVGLQLKSEHKHTPFISIFTLIKHGSTS